MRAGGYGATEPSGVLETECHRPRAHKPAHLKDAEHVGAYACAPLTWICNMQLEPRYVLNPQGLPLEPRYLLNPPGLRASLNRPLPRKLCALQGECRLIANIWRHLSMVSALSTASMVSHMYEVSGTSQPCKICVSRTAASLHLTQSQQASRKPRQKALK